MVTARQNPELLERVAKRLHRRSTRRSGLLIVALTCATLCAFTPITNFVATLTAQVDDAAVTYRLLSERDSLIAANQRLQEEVDGLRAVKYTGAGFEASVRAQLEELQGIVESATTLDLGNRASSTIAKQKKKGKSELAAVLNEANKPSKSTQAHKGKKPGIGGRECSPKQDSECVGPASKQNISLSGDSSQWLGGVSGSLVAPTQQDLANRVRNISLVLRALPMGYPVEGEVSSGFGYRKSPFSRHVAFHEGLDISLAKGGDVLATGAGVIAAVSYERAYGWKVDVRHSSSVVTRYAHLSKPLVKIGQRVGRGDRIALSGSTGRSTGPHLHYEVRVNGRPRNPQAFVMLPQHLAKVF